MEETIDQQEQTTSIPRWTPDFDVSTFDLQAVFREAKEQKKSAGHILKSLGYPVAKYFSWEVPDFKSADGTIPVTASSTAIDLSDDDFDVSAIEQMKAAAIGTTVFLNHKYDVPEDVYGKVAATSIEKRKVYSPIAGEYQNHTCLDLDISPVGAEENPRAVQITNMLQKSKLKLGVSVTVLILEWKKRGDGGRRITKIFYIESSMVGIPCNQTAWAQHTEKSFKEPVMSVEKSANANPDSAATNKASFEQVMKAMFADVLDDNQNNLWMYISSLSTVVNRILRDVRGKDADAQAEAIAEGSASVDEFAATFKEWFPKEVAEEAAKEERTRDYWWDYYSAIGRVRDVVQKAGARNSAADQELIRKAHDCMKSLLPEVCGEEHGEATSDAALKSASVAASPELVTKAAELESKVASLEAKKAELEGQLEKALETAEQAAELLELEKATSLAAVTALEKYSLELLPRAGTQSVS